MSKATGLELAAQAELTWEEEVVVVLHMSRLLAVRQVAGPVVGLETFELVLEHALAVGPLEW